MDLESIVLHEMGCQFSESLASVAFTIVYTIFGDVSVPFGCGFVWEGIGEHQSLVFPRLFRLFVPLRFVMNGIGFESQQCPSHQGRIAFDQYELLLKRCLQT